MSERIEKEVISQEKYMQSRQQASTEVTGKGTWERGFTGRQKGK